MSEKYGALCDKCGCPVPPENDTCYVMRALFEMATETPEGWGDGGALAQFMVSPSPNRHFLPVVSGDGKVLCEGSPSRAQYIEGQPRDPRPEYPYCEQDEKAWREAFYFAQSRRR